MNRQDVADPSDSLFSLELVVEKLYIPHTPCKFPAIAFRLLDFPTILIKHVEDDLATAIRNKISFDPYYQLPDQFSELKDKHGNFMVKKGKSCLFKIYADLLKQHLASTPLYVMVIDMFPEVPKLVGNSTVPLNTLMDSICMDIARLGSTVPSVHGDKGLFKLYNLMGKEIGYFVLGFRLLCLGPSLIPHLPDSVLVHRQLKGARAKAEKTVEKMLDNSLKQLSEVEDEAEIEVRNSACMTDPVKHDVLLQTVDMEDKATTIVVSGVERETQTKSGQEKESHSATTQTEKRKRFKEALNNQKKWFDTDGTEQYEDDNDVIMTNIVCPPPLFYNSEANPQVEIERTENLPVLANHEMCLEDLSEIDSFDGEGIKEMHLSYQNSGMKPMAERQNNSTSKHSIPYVPQSRHGEFVTGLQVAPQPDIIFPLLTALINELACVQNPQFLLDVSNKMQAAGLLATKPHKAAVEKVEKAEVISPSVVSAVAAALAKKSEVSKDIVSKSETSIVSKPQHSPQTRVPAKTKLEEKVTKQASAPVSKKKLVYKLTTTQRLRLQKTNPKWLEKAEREVSQVTASRQIGQKTQPELLDINATNFSDTLTEVRRLAEMELNSTAGGDTLQHIASEAEGKSLTLSQSTMEKAGHQRQTRRSSTQKTEQKSGWSPNKKSPIPNAKSRLRHRRAEHQRNISKDSSDSDELVKRKKPVPLERHISGISSPAPPDAEQNSAGYEEPLSARSDLPSSRSRSIEVHLPSAQPHLHDDSGSGTITDAEDSQPEEDDDEVDIPLPDDSTAAEKPQVQVLNFPRYISREDSLPETIAGAANASFNASGTLNEDSPLESTRHSQNMHGSEGNDSRNQHQQSSDLDTRQFHSTDEPELQDLVSEADNRSHSAGGRRSVTETGNTSKFPVINPQLSENSPVPSVRRSTSKFDPGTGNSYLPSMSMSKGYTSPVSSRPGTPKSTLAQGNRFEHQPLPGKGSTVVTPRNKLTPRSQSGSPKRPTPRARRPLRESIHTDSLSSYLPSDPDNVLVSLSSSNKSGASGGNYSDDFNSGDSVDVASSVELPKIISSAKLGYTIN
ncbi:microtubule-associated protein 10-like [Plakobranchus ocellatus]|uniref:Microtubule-associated protein 10-like n=1 Tax=Plakobranchus ocellatus TaxID=259542 RepID=A0AAV4AZZ0_9GAST|nr:microtubule-associated protein 10-like [Plakobranchus ocellatus]